MKKNVLITGASSEIGLSITKRLEKDYNLFLIKHNKEIDCSNFINNPIIYSCDLSCVNQINDLLNKLKSIKIDILINVAAYDQDNVLEDVVWSEFEKSFSVNVIAPFMLIQGLFDKDDNGIIINIASTDGLDTFNKYNITYATSKAALIHLTKQLSIIYKKMNIYVLCPNYINTESVRNMEPNFLESELKRINQKKLIEVEDVSKKIEELINSKKRENTIIIMR